MDSSKLSLQRIVRFGFPWNFEKCYGVNCKWVRILLKRMYLTCNLVKRKITSLESKIGNFQAVHNRTKFASFVLEIYMRCCLLLRMKMTKVPRTLLTMHSLNNFRQLLRTWHVIYVALLGSPKLVGFASWVNFSSKDIADLIMKQWSHGCRAFL